MTHIEATPGHDTGIIATIPEVAHDANAPHTEITAINPAMTHHTDPTADHPHTEVSQPTTPEIEVDPVHVHPTNLQERFLQITFTFQQITRQITPQEEPESENRRSPNGLLQF